MKTKPPRIRKPGTRLEPSHRANESEAHQSEPTGLIAAYPAALGNLSPCHGGHIQVVAPGKLRVATLNAALADRLKALAFARLVKVETLMVQRYELTVDALAMTEVGRRVFTDLLKGVVRL